MKTRNYMGRALIVGALWTLLSTAVCASWVVLETRFRHRLVEADAQRHDRQVGSTSGVPSGSPDSASALAAELGNHTRQVAFLGTVWLAGLGGIGWATVLLVHKTRQIEQSWAILRAQHDLVAELAGISELEPALTRCLAVSLAVSGLDCGGIYLTPADGGLELAVHQGLSSDSALGVTHYGIGSPQARLIRGGQPLYTRYNDMPIAPESRRLTDPLRAIAVLPILHNKQIVACMNLASRTVDEVPRAVRLPLESLAAQIGSAIARIRAEEEAKRQQRLVAERDLMLAQSRAEQLERAMEQWSSAIVITDLEASDPDLREFVDMVVCEMPGREMDASALTP